VEKGGQRALTYAGGVEIAIDVAGEVVERQELLNGTETVSLEGESEDGRWAMSGLVTWNIGLVSSAGEGDITLLRDDGGEIFATLVRGDIVDAADGQDDAAHTMRLEYEIDGGTGAFASAAGTCDAVGLLAAATFRGRWTLRLVNGTG
jgi:hypothetical protein